MKHIIFSLLLVASSLYAQETETITRDVTAKIRIGKKLKEQTVTIDNLLTQDAFDGKYFRIVNHITETPIKIDYDNNYDLTLRAATAYHHLSKAREYFANNVKNLDLLIDDKITVRLNIKNKHDEIYHYRSDVHEQFNHIQAHQSSGPMAHREWGREIWIHEAREVKYNSTGDLLSVFLMQQRFTDELKNRLMLRDVSQAVNAYMQSFKDPRYYEFHLYQVILTIGLTETVPFIFKVGNVFKKKYYFDPAYVPELLYNEYSHLALSKHLYDGTKTHILSGITNYYAYKISGLAKLKARTNGALKGEGVMNAKNKLKYSMEEEFGQEAKKGEFVLGVFADIDREMPEIGNEIIERSIKYYTPESSLNISLRRALVFGLDEVCDLNKELNCEAEKRQLRNLTQERGI
jgi:hypothetical protein